MCRLLASVALVLACDTAQAEPATRPRGEFLRMWDAILSGQPPVNGVGWFGPAKARYTWDRLKVHDTNQDGRISPKELGARTELFAALDRDGDGAITADDLDWSESAPYFRQLGIAQQLLRQGDNDGNKKLTKEEWAKLYDELAKDKKAVEAEDLRRLLFPPARGGGRPGGGMPSQQVLLYGLLTGEIGSGAEGPKLDAPAPDFTLKSPDGKTTITLSDFKDKKPVVLIFGSFT